MSGIVWPSDGHNVTMQVLNPPEHIAQSCGTSMRFDEVKHLLSDKPLRRGGRKKLTKKIAIVGKAPSSRMEAPYDDPSWEIWGLADLYTVVPRWDRWFEIHELDSRIEKWSVKAPDQTVPSYWEWLQINHGKPIYVREAHPKLPYATVYPKEAVVQRFASLVCSVGTDGQRHLAYFTNSVSWMVALAIHEGASDIGLWGVDMAQHGDGVKSEYAYQRPSCEFFLGVAAGMGCRVMISQHSDLLKARRLYGFDSDTNAMRLKWKARHEELSKELQEISQGVQNLIGRDNILRGHLDELTHWPEGEQRAARDKYWQEQLAQNRAQVDITVKRQHVLLGALDDMSYWREWAE